LKIVPNIEEKGLNPNRFKKELVLSLLGGKIIIFKYLKSAAC
jgi:hypothetical protein